MYKYKEVELKGLKSKLINKGQSNEIFDPQFFSSFELIWASDKQVKAFSNSVSILLRYSSFSIKKLTPRSTILYVLRGVKKKFYTGT